MKRSHIALLSDIALLREESFIFIVFIQGADAGKPNGEAGRRTLLPPYTVFPVVGSVGIVGV